MIYQQMLMLQFLQVINIGIAGLLSIKLLCVTLPHMSICTWVVVAITFKQVDTPKYQDLHQVRLQVSEEP